MGDVPDLTADPTLAEAELGFSAPRDLETMCRDLWNWQTKNPQGYDTPIPTPAPEAAQVVDPTPVHIETSEIPVEVVGVPLVPLAA